MDCTFRILAVFLYLLLKSDLLTGLSGDAWPPAFTHAFLLRLLWAQSCSPLLSALCLLVLNPSIPTTEPDGLLEE